MKPGRKSAAALSVVSPISDARPQPTDDLNEAQQAEWRAIVRRLPGDWFPRETHGILASYCRHVTTHKLISDAIDLYEPDWLKDDDGLKRLGTLTAMRERESRAMVNAARSLRITKSSQFRPESAARAAQGGASDGRKPWDTTTDSS